MKIQLRLTCNQLTEKEMPFYTSLGFSVERLQERAIWGLNKKYPFYSVVGENFLIIKSLRELKSFIEEVKAILDCECIIGIDENDKGRYLEIYNDYRE